MKIPKRILKEMLLQLDAYVEDKRDLLKEDEWNPFDDWLFLNDDGEEVAIINVEELRLLIKELLKLRKQLK